MRNDWRDREHAVINHFSVITDILRFSVYFNGKNK